MLPFQHALNTLKELANAIRNTGNDGSFRTTNVDEDVFLADMENLLRRLDVWLSEPLPLPVLREVRLQRADEVKDEIRNILQQAWNQKCTSCEDCIDLFRQYLASTDHPQSILTSGYKIIFEFEDDMNNIRSLFDGALANLDAKIIIQLFDLASASIGHAMRRSEIEALNREDPSEDPAVAFSDFRYLHNSTFR